MDRREFLSTTAAGLGATFFAAGSSPALALVQGSHGSGDAALNALFEKIFQDRVKRYPELATSLGLDKGENAHLKSELDVRPTAAARAEDLAKLRQELASIRAIPNVSLSQAAKLNKDVIVYQIETNIVPGAKFGIDSAQRPYPITQQGGSYFSTPDFLNTAHTIDTAADAEAYLSRLAQVGKTIDNDTVEQRAQATRGFLAPAWSIDLALGQMRKLREAAPEANTHVTSVSASSGHARPTKSGANSRARSAAEKVVTIAA